MGTRLEELYKTGNYISIALNGFGNYERLDYNLHTYPDPQYTFIHIKHSEVLDHVLNGGKVKYKNTWTFGDFFFDSYHKDNTYEIIKDEPSLNGSLEHETFYKCAICGYTSKIQNEAHMCGKPKPVERITIEDVDEWMKLAYLRGYEDRMHERDYDFHSHRWEYLEANQKEK